MSESQSENPAASSVNDDASTPRLIVRDLVVERSGRLVLDAVSFALGRGQMLGVRGENGSGKTTLLRALAGITRPASGSVLLDGNDIATSTDASRREVALVSHAGGLIADVPVATTFAQWRALHASRPEAETSDWIEKLGIRDLIERRPFEMSQGQQRRCALAQLAVRDASLWLLDEPMAALDAESREVVDALVRSRLREGATVVVSTHDDWPVVNEQINDHLVRELQLETVAEDSSDVDFRGAG